MSSLLSFKWIAAAAVPAALLFAGCGGSGGSGAPEESPIESLVTDVSDASFDEARFESMFVVNNAPPEEQRQRYRIYMYRTKSVDISIDSAKALVEIEHGTSGEILGEYEWTFLREGGEWKLTAAPLPEN